MPSPPATEPLLVVVDVTDTLGSGWRAGIQRVVLQLVRNLDDADPRIRLLPVVWSPALRAHRRLKPEELEDLFGESNSGGSSDVRGAARGPNIGTSRPAWYAAARKVAGRVLRGARHLVALALAFLRLKEPLKELLRTVSLRTIHRDQVPLAVELPPGSVLFELDTVWNQVQVDRDALYRELQGRGVHVAALVYDLLPLEHPEWFEASLVQVFDTALTAQARHAEAVLAISRATAVSLGTWAKGRGIDVAEPTVIGLGADSVPVAPSVPVALGPSESDPLSSQSPLPSGVTSGRYVLVVGTVEPRKNHAVLLDAFEQLAEHVEDLQLVVVGRPGWENDRVVRRLEAHPLAGTKLHWFSDADDDLLSTLYEHALVVAVPSATEGFGLPVIEAFRHGIPVVASTGGALPEAGGDLAEYVDPDDVDGWSAAITRHATDSTHATARRAALDGWVPPAWSDTAKQVSAVLVEAFGNERAPSSSG